MEWIYAAWLFSAVFASGGLGGVYLFAWIGQRVSHGAGMEKTGPKGGE